MIQRAEVIPLLLNASPSFDPRWQAYTAEASYEPGLLYVDLGEVARHVLELYRVGAEAELEAVFEVVERLHVEGDDVVREAATIGFLEGLQNNASHGDIDPEVFRAYLGPESRHGWDALNRFWSGESPRVE